MSPGSCTCIPAMSSSTCVSPCALIPTQPSFIRHVCWPLTTHTSLIHTFSMHPGLRPCIWCPHPHVSDTSASPHILPHSLSLGHVCVPSHCTPHPHPCSGTHCIVSPQLWTDMS